MTKRTFVLFFCLAQFLAFLLFSQQQVGACKLDVGTNGFSPFAIEMAEMSDHFVLIDDSICKNQTIVRADDCEWKENLSDLLRHRHSTYRFLTLVNQAAPDYIIQRTPKVIRESIKLLSVTRGVITLPDYYSFLHRLCPF